MIWSGGLILAFLAYQLVGTNLITNRAQDAAATEPTAPPLPRLRLRLPVERPGMFHRRWCFMRSRFLMRARHLES
jgi:hypothetical protein